MTSLIGVVAFALMTLVTFTLFSTSRNKDDQLDWGVATLFSAALTIGTYLA